MAIDLSNTNQANALVRRVTMAATQYKQFMQTVQSLSDSIIAEDVVTQITAYQGTQ